MMYASHGLVDEVEADLDRLNRIDLAGAGPAETETVVVAIGRLEAKLAAFKAKACRRYELERTWALKGAQHPAAVVAKEQRVPSRTCKRAFTLGRKLEELPALADALARGAVTVQHRDRILGIDSARVHDAFVADHPRFVAWAETLDWSAFDARLVLWLHQQDPDGPDPGDDKRGLRFSQTWRDEFVLDGRMGTVKGTIFGNELTRLYDILFKRDWQQAKDRLGREPHDHELGRTPPQRRLDALIHMAERSATGPEKHRKGAILASIFLGGDTARWLCETTTGIRFRPGQLGPHLDDLQYETFLFGEDMHDVSASKLRFFLDALRRAAQGKGPRVCFHPTCDRPVSECQIDHKTPYSKGGTTSIGNSQPGCPFHNRRKSDTLPTDEGPAP